MEKNEKTSEEYTDLKEKIEIISTEDDKIKSIGELLSNDSSRDILKLVLDSTMTASQIAQKAGISLPLTIYHLKKMQDLGIVSVTITKENDSKYYTSSKFAFIITSAKISEKARSSKSLFNSLKRIYRFVAIGFGGLVSWITLQNMNPEYSPGMRAPVSLNNGPAIQQSTPVPGFTTAVPAPAATPNTPLPYMSPIEPSAFSHEILMFVIPLVVIIAGLVIERILSAYKR